MGNVQNTFVGASAGINNKGSENTFFGSSAGSNNILGTKNIFIGAMAGPVTTNLNKSMGIGYNAKVACDNCAVIGGTGVDAMKVGIGTDSPTDLLHVKGENARITTESISGFYAGVRSIESTGDYFAGIINSHYVIFDNDGGTSRIFVEKGSGDIGIGTGQPTRKLDVNGTVRIRNVPTGTGDFVRIDASGNLYRSSTAARIGTSQNTEDLLEEQKKENGRLKKSNETQNEMIADLEEKMDAQQQQITELKFLVEKLLIQNAETPKSTSYVLPLEQKALLAQNQPNPFNENTLVDYFIPATVKQAHIQVTTFDGKVIGKVDITKMGKGQVTIQSKSYPAGTYFYSLVLDGQVMETKRMVLAR